MLAVRPWMQLRKSACIRAPSRDSAQPPFPARPGRVGFDGPPSPQQGCADFPDAWQVLADDVGGFYSAGHRRTDDFIKLQLQACESQVEQGWWCSPVPGGVLDARPGTGLRRPAPLHSQPRGRLGHVQLRGPRGPQPRRARWPSPGKLRRR
ncbi:uncharacterized protein AAG666_023222 isoform 1-T11 [Megaptera novaeangliae]